MNLRGSGHRPGGHRGGQAPAARRLAIVTRTACLVLAVGWTAIAAPQTPSSPSSPPQAAASTLSPPHASTVSVAPEGIDLWRARLGDLTLSYGTRLSAARRLLEDGSDAALAALAATLAAEAEPTARSIAFRAMVEWDGPPGLNLKPILWQCLPKASDDDQLWLCILLGRYADPADASWAVQTAHDPAAAERERRGAILLLGQVRSRQIAAMLVELVGNAQPEFVRRAASLALEQQTGQTLAGDDPQRWIAWWRQREALDELAWQREVTSRFAGTAARREVAQRLMVERLADANRQLYRSTTDSAQQERLLISLVGDGQLESMRELGLELAQKRHLDQQTIGEPLLRALLVCLEDPSPTIRSRAAVLLRLLDSTDAADIVARRLAKGIESHPLVLPTYVRMMARMPRSSAVVRLLQLLDDPALRADAAGALVRAYDVGLLGQEQLDRVGDRVRALVSGDRPPPAPFVLLLGRVGQPEDWMRIERWLDSDDQTVREAAATAWARSTQPVVTLLRRADDEVIAPIAINAAADRGKEPQTLDLLLTARPFEASAMESWTRAVLAMAGRVEPRALINAIAVMPQDSVLLALRERVLDVVIGRLDPTIRDPGADDDVIPATQTARPSLDPMSTSALVDALLARGQVKLDAGEPREALTDFRRAGDWLAGLSDPARRRSCDRGLFQALLQADDTPEAFAHAREMIQGSTNQSETTWLADTAMSEARTARAAGQQRRVERIIAGLRDLLGTPLPQPHSEEAKALLQPLPADSSPNSAGPGNQSIPLIDTSAPPPPARSNKPQPPR